MTAAERLSRQRVVIAGRVQGVWFRESCRSQAEALSVRGWVRNRDDGTVEAIFEGALADVEAIITWCRVGPPHASVTSVVSTAEIPVGEPAFTVR